MMPPIPTLRAALGAVTLLISTNILAQTSAQTADIPGSATSKNAVPAPNMVAISPQLVTSGQPSADQLAALGAQGFEAVIYLAPPWVSDAVLDEAQIIGRQGMVNVNIPIQFNNPTEKDFETFAAVLQALGKRKVLVHCQVNMRASSMTFLYRTIVLKEDPHKAYEAVSKIWVPEGPWKKLIQEQLKKHQIKFDSF